MPSPIKFGELKRYMERHGWVFSHLTGSHHVFVKAGYRSLSRRLVVILSLVLCIAVGLLWVQSYWISDGIHFQYRHWHGLLLTNSSLGVESSSGGLRLTLASAQHQCADATEMAKRRSYDSEHFGRSWGRRPTAGYPRGMASYNPGIWPGLRLGLGYGYSLRPPRDGYDTIQQRWATLPHAAVVLPLTCLPLLRWRRHRNQQRRIYRQAHSLCPHCGYDLRASPDRCPECGTTAAHATTLSPGQL